MCPISVHPVVEDLAGLLFLPFAGLSRLVMGVVCSQDSPPGTVATRGHRVLFLVHIALVCHSVMNGRMGRPRDGKRREERPVHVNCW